MGSLAASNQVVMSWQRYTDCTRRREAETIYSHFAERAPNKRLESDCMTAAWRMEWWVTFTRVLMTHRCCCTFYKWNETQWQRLFLCKDFQAVRRWEKDPRNNQDSTQYPAHETKKSWHVQDNLYYPTSGEFGFFACATDIKRHQTKADSPNFRICWSAGILMHSHL